MKKAIETFKKEIASASLGSLVEIQVILDRLMNLTDERINSEIAKRRENKEDISEIKAMTKGKVEKKALKDDVAKYSFTTNGAVAVEDLKEESIAKYNLITLANVLIDDLKDELKSQLKSTDVTFIIDKDTVEGIKKEFDLV